MVTFWNQGSHIHRLNHGLNAGNFWQSLMKLPPQWAFESLKFTPEVFRCHPDAQKGLSPPEDLRQEKNTTLLRAKRLSQHQVSNRIPGSSPGGKCPTALAGLCPYCNLSTGIYGASVNRLQLQRRLENREDNIQLYARECENRSDMTVL